MSNLFFHIIVKYIPFTIYVIHSLSTINTAYYFKGLVITDKKKMAKNYFNSDFWIDFLALAPLLFSYILDIS